MKTAAATADFATVERGNGKGDRRHGILMAETQHPQKQEERRMYSRKARSVFCCVLFLSFFFSEHTYVCMAATRKALAFYLFASSGT